MTTLYRPVEITSNEHALRLPGETVFIADAGDRYDHRGDGRLRLPNGVDLAIDLAAGRQVTALVPVEAEEETDTIETGEGYFCTRTRYTTPWEEA